MSKVIKTSPDFIAGEIFPQKASKPAVWGELTKPTDSLEKTQQNTKTKGSLPGKQLSIESSADIQKASQYDSDFTAPELLEEKKRDPHAAASDEVVPQQNHIDLEALMEEYFNKGLQAGRERAEIEYGSSSKALLLVCEQLNTIRETILSNSMQEMQNLVMVIAEKIIRQSVVNQKDTIIQTVEYAIQNAVKSDEFIISVNKDDYDTIKSRSADFINSISGLENIIVKADPVIEQGGCLIESSNCTVDATIATQLEIISEKLKSQ